MKYEFQMVKSTNWQSVSGAWYVFCSQGVRQDFYSGRVEMAGWHYAWGPQTSQGGWAETAGQRRGNLVKGRKCMELSFLFCNL